MDLSKHGVRPVIHEIARTEVVFPRIKLLVEDNTIQDAAPTASGTPRQGFRLWLTDGEHRIQGVSPQSLKTDEPMTYYLHVSSCCETSLTQVRSCSGCG